MAEKRTFPAGTVAWVPDEDMGYIVVRTPKGFKQGDAGTPAVVLGREEAGGGDEVYLTAAQTAAAEATDSEALKVVDDMVKLGDLREASILHNLRERFYQDDIYTNIGTILVSVNPFRPLALYTPDILEAYARVGTQVDEGGAVLPPHVYKLTDQAYKQMVATGEVQSCLVSGESGAGKTEAVKLMLQFLTEMSAKVNQSEWGEQGRLQEQILKANPLMEAFGNAKTVRNNNSSRFGKFVEISFNSKKGNIIGGSVTPYLLEKSRIVHQGANERNYHIFYEMCAACSMSDEWRKKLHLLDADQYKYLVDPDASVGIRDDHGWEQTISSMVVLGMSAQERDDVMRTAAAILHLGNITFNEIKVQNVDQACEIGDKTALDRAAHMLGFPPDALGKALTRKSLNMSAKAQDVFQHYTIPQAEEAKDALAKSLYDNLFTWLIRRINWALLVAGGAIAAESSQLKGKISAAAADENLHEAIMKQAVDQFNALTGAGGGSGLKEKDGSTSSIGVLDIFGFESFLVNSFEQLCINYCNEKLQGYFTEHIFKLEQSEYAAEGLSQDLIAFKDNAEIVDMLEAKRTGLFALIDDEISVPRGTDETFLSKAFKKFEKSPYFKKQLKAANQFIIVHFAGEVSYTVTGFLAKNKDTLALDLSTLCEQSSTRFLRAIFFNAATAAPDAAAAKKPSAAGVKLPAAPVPAPTGGKRSLVMQFSMSLAALMSSLQKSNPHFIRCVKPNKALKGGVFDGAMVLEQLRYAGLLEVCKIRKSGFPVRKPHGPFAWRYSILYGAVSNAKTQPRTVCEGLERKKLLAPNEYRLGNSKVFLRSEAYERLERCRDELETAAATKIQRRALIMVRRAWLKKCKRILKQLEAATKSKKVDDIEAALLEAGELPYQGRHLVQVKEARRVMQVVEEERRVEALLIDALKQESLDVLLAAVAAASSAKYQSKTLQACNDAIADLKLDKASLSALEKELNTAKRDRKALEAAIAACTARPRIGASHPLLERAMATLKRVVVEDKAVAELSEAIKSNDLALIKTRMDALASLGMSDHPLVAEGAKVAKVAAEVSANFQASIDACLKLAAEATKARDHGALRRVRNTALELNLAVGAHPVLAAAFQVLDALDRDATFSGILAGARQAMALKSARVNGIAPADLTELSDAVEAAKKAGVSERDPEMLQAVQALARATTQIEMQKRLKSLLDDPVQSKDYAALRQALLDAEGLGMGTVDVLVRVREKVILLEAGVARSEMAAAKPELGSMDEDEVERINKEKMVKAASPGYFFGNYFRIRSDADFSRGILFNKNKPIHLKLVSQTEPLHKSLLDLEPNLSRIAVRVSRSILGYAGDQAMAFPASLAQDLVDKVLAMPEIADEVYIQLCKHLTGNQDAQSIGRTWQLMCICVAAFPPSSGFELYLTNFLLRYQASPGIIGSYAVYAMRRLQSTVMYGATTSRVSIEEIVAYGERPPLIADIVLTDGTPITSKFPIPPHMNVDDVMRICQDFLGMKDERKECFGIFVREDKGKEVVNTGASEFASLFVPPPPPSAPPPSSAQGPSMPDGLRDAMSVESAPPPPEDDDDQDEGAFPPRTMYPLLPNQFLGDVALSVARSKDVITYVFKRKIFFGGVEKTGRDSVYNRLIYLQALDETCTGNWHVPTQERAVELAAVSVAVDLGDDFPSTPKALLEDGLLEYFPIPWRSKLPAAEWANLVLKRRNDLASQPMEDLQLLYIQLCSELPYFGSTIFYVRKQEFGSDFMFAVNTNGVRMATVATRQIVGDWQFASLKKFSGGSRSITLDVIGQGPQVLYTSQAREIAGLMLEHVRWNEFKITPDLPVAPSRTNKAASTKTQRSAASNGKSSVASGNEPSSAGSVSKTALAANKALTKGVPASPKLR